MRHNQYEKKFDFVKEPELFTKDTEKDLLSFCLGGTLYMPATREFYRNVTDKRIPGLTSMVMCFEDAIDESKVPEAEDNAVKNLKEIKDGMESGTIDPEDMPLMFMRARNPEQFRELIEKIDPELLGLLTGFVFPKFTSKNGKEYFDLLAEANEKSTDVLYGMPILESKQIAFKETRFDELLAMKSITDANMDKVLNIRVGGTDFSSAFGVRRGIDYSIYDIMTVRDCLLDILNVFGRENEYVVSGPVWEYFLANKDMKFEKNQGASLQSSLLKRKRLIDVAIDGLLREVILDRANGFIGKTAIHPTHIKYINAMLTVTEEEYDDAVQILNTSGGVVKSANANKMNEINPHRSWARKIYNRARAYGVVKDETEYLSYIAQTDLK